MYALHDRYYGGARQNDFERDLAGKSHVIELRDDVGLRGFSTLCLQRYAVAEETGLALFSGDTIIEREFWGEQALARGFCRFAGRVRGEHPKVPLFWFLISKGYRTYRYLQAFARRYYPHPVMPTPPDMQRRMDALAHARFGNCYSRETGIVRLPTPAYLRSPWNAVRPALHARSEVRFFLERNPGYVNGDELVCITELRGENLRSIAAREFELGLADALHAHAS